MATCVIEYWIKLLGCKEVEIYCPYKHKGECKEKCGKFGRQMQKRDNI